MEEARSCSNCGYAGTCGADRCCDYILIERHCRPCPAGDGCAAWRSKAEVKKRSAAMDDRPPIVPTRNAMLWQTLFRRSDEETSARWKAARQQERAAALAQLNLGSRGRRELNQG